MSEDISPVCLSGSITKAPELSFCMDDATHLIYTTKGDAIRLKAANKEILEQLQNYTDAKCIVTICGAYSIRPECPLLEVSWIGLKEDFLKQTKTIKLFDALGEFPHGNK